MCILLKLHYAKFDVSSLCCSKVIEEKPLVEKGLICQNKDHLKPSKSEIFLSLCIDSSNVSHLVISFISIKERMAVTTKCKTKGLVASYNCQWPEISVKISQLQIGSDTM